jgi:hypothetical protein
MGREGWTQHRQVQRLKHIARASEDAAGVELESGLFCREAVTSRGASVKGDASTPTTGARVAPSHAETDTRVSAHGEGSLVAHQDVG